MIEATIIGAGIMAFIAVYMFFKLGENTGQEHIFYQLLLLGIIMFSILTLGGATFRASNCDLIPTNSTLSGNTTIYEYDYICQETPAPISLTFLKVTQWFWRLSLTYIILYFINKTLLYMGVDLIERTKRRFK